MSKAWQPRLFVIVSTDSSRLSIRLAEVRCSEEEAPAQKVADFLRGVNEHLRVLAVASEYLVPVIAHPDGLGRALPLEDLVEYRDLGPGTPGNVAFLKAPRALREELLTGWLRFGTKTPELAALELASMGATSDAVVQSVRAGRGAPHAEPRVDPDPRGHNGLPADKRVVSWSNAIGFDLALARATWPTLDDVALLVAHLRGRIATEPRGASAAEILEALVKLAAVPDAEGSARDRIAEALLSMLREGAA